MTDCYGETPFTPTMADIDLTTLDIQQSLDYIKSLRIALLYPGTDFSPNDDPQKLAYVCRIEEVKAHLATDLGYTG